MILKNKIFSTWPLGPDYFPFLAKWVENQIQEISSDDYGVPRKGIPKKGRKPLSKERKLFCLAKAFDDDLKLKTYAEVFEQNYVVVRRWNNDPQIKKAIADLRKQFAMSFVNKMEETLTDDNNDLDHSIEAEFNCTKFSFECFNYDLVIAHTIEDLLLEKIENTPANQKIVWYKVHHALPIQRDKTYELHLYPKKTKKEKRLASEEEVRYGQRMKRAQHYMVDHMIAEINKGASSSVVVSHTEQIKDMLDYKDEEIRDLRISIINKGKQRGDTNG